MEDIIKEFLGKFIYFELQGRNRGYSEITEVESCSVNENDIVVINGCQMFELNDAKTLINNKILNKSLDDFALTRIYHLSNKIEDNFKLYKWGNN
jgi:hypothetical protein